MHKHRKFAPSEARTKYIRKDIKTVSSLYSGKENLFPVLPGFPKGQTIIFLPGGFPFW